MSRTTIDPPQAVPKSDYLSSISLERNSNDRHHHDLIITTPRVLHHAHTVSKDRLHKPFVGGFKSRKTGRRYHHAGVQHPFKPRYKNKENMSISRNTQTVHTSNAQQQTTRDTAQQMKRSDLLLDESNDKSIKIGMTDEIPKNRKHRNASNHSIPSVQPQCTYYDAKQLRLDQIDSAVTIQCAFRLHSARKHHHSLKSQKSHKLKEQRTKLKAEQKRLERLQNGIRYKREHPEHSHQFKQLIASLSKAQNEQLTSVLKAKHIPKAIKSKTKSRMIHSHNKQLRNLQQRQLKTQRKHKKQRKCNLLQEMMSPKTWIMSDGRPVSVRTPTTHRAEQVIFVYNALKDQTLSKEHRLSLLSSLRKMVESEVEITSMDIHSLVMEILDLVEREKDMIARKRPKKSLRGLRKRLLGKYFDLLLVPQFNPESARFSSTPRHVPRKVRPRRVSKSYKKTKTVRRKSAVTPSTRTFVTFSARAPIRATP